VLGAVNSKDAGCAYAFVVAAVQHSEHQIRGGFEPKINACAARSFYEFEVHGLADYGRFMDTVAENLEMRRTVLLQHRAGGPVRNTYYDLNITRSYRPVTYRTEEPRCETIL